MEECAKLCREQEGCDYFYTDAGIFNGVDGPGDCMWYKPKDECSGFPDDGKRHHNLYALHRDTQGWCKVLCIKILSQ